MSDCAAAGALLSVAYGYRFHSGLRVRVGVCSALCVCVCVRLCVLCSLPPPSLPPLVASARLRVDLDRRHVSLQLQFCNSPELISRPN